MLPYSYAGWNNIAFNCDILLSYNFVPAIHYAVIANSFPFESTVFAITFISNFMYVSCLLGTTSGFFYCSSLHNKKIEFKDGK